MAGGAVRALVVHGTNPAYTLPPAAGFREAMGQVGFKVVITPQMNETAALADLVLPDRTRWSAGGTRAPAPASGPSSSRPCAGAPLRFPECGDILLAAGAGAGQDFGAETFHDYLRNRWSERHAAAGAPGGRIQRVLARGARTGVVEMGAPATPRPPSRHRTGPSPSTAGLDGDEDGLTLVVYPSSRFGDGRGANRTWLQELPDPVAKITWHSWVEMHPDTARERGSGRATSSGWPRPTARSSSRSGPTPGSGPTPWRSPWVAVTRTRPLGRRAGREPHGAPPRRGGAGVRGARAPGDPGQVEPTGRHRRLATIEGGPDLRPAHHAGGAAGSWGHHGDATTAATGQLRELQGMGGFVPVPPTDAPRTSRSRAPATATTTRPTTPAGPWPSTWTSAPGARPASRPASPRTTWPWWARTRS
jgi:hypothetical protein